MFFCRSIFSAVFVYLVFMCKNVLLDLHVRSMLYAYTSKKLYIFCRYALQSVVFRCAISVAAGTAAPLVLLLLPFSTVLCACMVMIALLLVVVITRDFESQLKSSGRVTHSQSF